MVLIKVMDQEQVIPQTEQMGILLQVHTTTIGHLGFQKTQTMPVIIQQQTLILVMVLMYHQVATQMQTDMVTLNTQCLVDFMHYARRT